jgi:hypothetical protein
MPTYRIVLKSDASTPEAAAEFVRQDTGGVVMHATAFPVIEEEDCRRVPVFSTDGHGSMPLPHGAYERLAVDFCVLVGCLRPHNRKAIAQRADHSV